MDFIARPGYFAIFHSKLHTFDGLVAPQHGTRREQAQTFRGCYLAFHPIRIGDFTTHHLVSPADSHDRTATCGSGDYDIITPLFPHGTEISYRILTPGKYNHISLSKFGRVIRKVEVHTRISRNGVEISKI